MKTTTRVFATALLLSLSTSAFAEIPSSHPDMMSLLGRGDFCTTIKDIDTTNLTLPFGKSMPKIAVMEKKQKLFDKISEKFRGKSEKREDRMEKKSEQFANHLEQKNTELRALATTDVEKAAVEKFIASVSAAETAKKTALDPIMKQIQIDTEALITAKSGLSASAIASAKASVESALASAKAACANGTDSATAKAAFKKAMESNASLFKNFKPSAELRKDLKTLERKNRDAIQKINDTFRDAMDDARDELEKALPNAKLHGKKEDNRRGKKSDDKQSNS